MQYKISQLILTPGAKSATTSEVYVSQPDSYEEGLAGKLFVLIEIESRKSDDIKIINFLVDNLTNNYYQNEKMILRERVKSVKIEHIFESALTKTNKNLAEFVRSEKIKFKADLINAIVGVVHGENIHFASLGKAKAFLIYKNKEVNAENPYNITDVLKYADAEAEQPQANLAKLFSSVISGAIPKGGYFVLTNETLPEYLSGKQMSQIITNLPPASATEQIKNVLSQVNAYVSFLGLLIKNSADNKEIVAIPETPQKTAADSVVKLNNIQNNTDDLLSPKGFVDAKKWMNLIKTSNTKMPIKSDKSLNLKDKIFVGERKGFFPQLQRLFITPILHIRRLTLSSRGSGYGEKQLPIFKILRSKSQILARTIRFWFSNLSVKNKILLAIGITCLLLLIQNLVILNLKHEKAENKEQYRQSVEVIEQKQNQVEASLLYNNEDRAKELLAEIQTSLNELPRKTEEQQASYNAILEKYNKQLEKIQHIVNIDDAAQIADLTSKNSQANPKNIFIHNNKIYVGDAKNFIYTLDLSNNALAAITDLNNSFNGAEYPSISNDGNIYYLAQNKIIKLNTANNEIENLSIPLSSGYDDLAAVSIYNNRLYVVDKNKNQIYKHTPISGGFGDASAWLETTADFSQASAMSIDGNIYVLKNDGQIANYLRGKADKDIVLSKPEPEITEATKFSISKELNYIYILEPAKNRLVVFNKSGEFLMQYQSDQFSDLKDFTVDEKNKSIYLLNGPSIRKVDAAHL